MSDYDPDTRPTVACPNPKCGHSIVIPPLIGEMSDRHPKWQRVEPGTVIPAGQPYRVERTSGLERATEYVYKLDIESDECHYWFVDSSWKPPQCGEKHPSNDSVIPCQLPPHHEGDHFSTSGCAGGGFNWPPLVLPTEPTWGIAVVGSNRNRYLGQWWLSERSSIFSGKADLELLRWRQFARSDVLDFIPLTDEQVGRIEAAR